MKFKNYLCAASIFVGTSLTIQAAVFTINATTFVGVQDAAGSNLISNSILQIGYFAGVDSSIDPSTYTPAQWGTFTAISGIDSLNPSRDTRTNDPFGLGTYTLNEEYNTGTPPDNLPSSYPVRFGVRVFDSVASTSGANYNTVSSSVNEWALTDPTVIPAPQAPNMLISATSDVGLTWQDGGVNAFKTTITAVPEPSSFALLGLGGMALLFRRRK